MEFHENDKEAGPRLVLPLAEVIHWYLPLIMFDLEEIRSPECGRHAPSKNIGKIRITNQIEGDGIADIMLNMYMICLTQPARYFGRNKA